jgi:hypothetical protein
MTAEEESRETKQEQDEGWHEPRFLDYMVMKVKPLPPNRILAGYRQVFEGRLRACAPGNRHLDE